MVANVAFNWNTLLKGHTCKIWELYLYWFTG